MIAQDAILKTRNETVVVVADIPTKDEKISNGATSRSTHRQQQQQQPQQQRRRFNPENIVDIEMGNFNNNSNKKQNNHHGQGQGQGKRAIETTAATTAKDEGNNNKKLLRMFSSFSSKKFAPATVDETATTTTTPAILERSTEMENFKSTKSISSSTSSVLLSVAPAAAETADPLDNKQLQSKQQQKPHQQKQQPYHGGTETTRTKISSTTSTRKPSVRQGESSTKGTTTTTAAAQHSNAAAPPFSPSSENVVALKSNARQIALLRLAVVIIWLAAACCVSLVVYTRTKQIKFKEFEIQYAVDAEKILETFHTTLDERLVAANTLATTLTMHAKYSTSSTSISISTSPTSNQTTTTTFPFVTMPDFVVAGSNARILADAAIIHWLPLVTDEQRNDWEEYAYQNRHQVDEEYEKGVEFRRQEDLEFGYMVVTDNNDDKTSDDGGGGGTNSLIGNNKNNNGNDRKLLSLSGEENITSINTFIGGDNDEENDNNSTTNSSNVLNDGILVVNNVVQDGSNYHYKIWDIEQNRVISDGNGPYLPIWQRSPVNQARQETLNIDMASSRGLFGIFPYWNFSSPSPSPPDEIPPPQAKKGRPKGALLHLAIIPHPNAAPFYDQDISISQYRHNTDSHHGTPVTKLSYPVFDGFGKDSNFVGVLAATISWQLSFLDIFRKQKNAPQGMICVIENSYSQVFSYRIDGPNATYLGEGDPLMNPNIPEGFIYEDMMVTTDSTEFYSLRPVQELRSYTTQPLDTDFAIYRLKVYPTRDTYAAHDEGSEPIIYTFLVAFIFLLAAVVFLLYDFYVRKRHKAMMDSGVEQANRVAAAEREAADAERELNEYLSHEVRNPLAAALSACSFVSSAVNEASPMKDVESIQAVRDDVHIINSSLRFIDDLLRNMLDLHRAVHHQVEIQTKPTDLYHDVLEPVASMLYCRDDNFHIQLECPKNLIVETDSLRLRQIILNLGRNAAKFVQKGFVRLRAEVVPINSLIYSSSTSSLGSNHHNDDNNDYDYDSHSDNDESYNHGDLCQTSSSNVTSPPSFRTIRIYVEDSGPGIPHEKRKTLFAKFQQSLDLLSQGTGVGLCLCKQLAQIMNGDLWLDESYNSGFQEKEGGGESYRGSRFVLELKLEASSFPNFLSSSTRMVYTKDFLATSTTSNDGDHDDTTNNNAAKEFSTSNTQGNNTSGGGGSDCGGGGGSADSSRILMMSGEIGARNTRGDIALELENENKVIDTIKSSSSTVDLEEGKANALGVKSSAPLFGVNPKFETPERREEVGLGFTQTKTFDNNSSCTPNKPPPPVKSLTEKVTATASSETKKHDTNAIPYSNPEQKEKNGGGGRSGTTNIGLLPESLSVLFVDDDMVLRKLFGRTIKKTFPGWQIQEASSGETAIRLIEQQRQQQQQGEGKEEKKEAFDLIFMDQYMASTEKQLLGTEATRELRSKGVSSIICGLSANDKEEAFLNAGADAFMLKPMPCKKEELERIMLKILQKNNVK